MVGSSTNSCLLWLYVVLPLILGVCSEAEKVFETNNLAPRKKFTERNPFMNLLRSFNPASDVCSIKEDGVEYTVDCSDLQLNYIPNDIPQNTTQLYLNENNIYDFSLPQTLWHLKTLSLASTPITSLSKSKFRTVPNLEILNLNFVDPSDVSLDVLSDLHNLRQLSFISYADTTPAIMRGDHFMYTPLLETLSIGTYKNNTFGPAYKFLHNLTTLQIVGIVNPVEVVNFTGLNSDNIIHLALYNVLTLATSVDVLNGVLANFTALKSLNLDCPDEDSVHLLGDQLRIASALPNATLETLVTAYAGSIPDSSGIIIPQSLENLKRLCLRGRYDPIDLLTTIRQMPYLEHVVVRLQNNFIELHEGDYVIDFLGNPELKILQFGYTNFDEMYTLRELFFDGILHDDEYFDLPEFVDYMESSNSSEIASSIVSSEMDSQTIVKGVDVATINFYFNVTSALEIIRLHDIFYNVYSNTSNPNATVITIHISDGNQVQVLDLGSGYFSSVNNVLVEEITGSTQLRVLNLPDLGISQLCGLRGMTKLRYLNIANNHISSLSSDGVSELISLEFFNASNNEISFLESNFFHSMRLLRIVDFSYNALVTLDGNAFQGSTGLAIILLNNNTISELPNGLFDSLYYLNFLDLSNNSLRAISAKLAPSEYLVLNISYNLIEMISSEDLTGPFRLAADFINNPLVCDCSHFGQEFVSWLTDPNIMLLNYDQLRCTYLGCKYMYVQYIKLEDFKEVCYVPHDTRDALIGTFTAIAVILLVFFVYWKRWSISWYFYLLRRRFLRVTGKTTTNPFPYHAFVAHNHDLDIDFVVDELLPVVEGQWQLSLCIGVRDFICGRPIAENIVDSIDNSRRTIIVLSRGFLESKWCEFELHMALTRGLRTLIMIVVEDMASANMSSLLRRLVRDVNYIQYVKEGPGNDLFWSRLKDALLSYESPDWMDGSGMYQRLSN